MAIGKAAKFGAKYAYKKRKEKKQPKAALNTDPEAVRAETWGLAKGYGKSKVKTWK